MLSNKEQGRKIGAAILPEFEDMVIEFLTDHVDHLHDMDMEDLDEVFTAARNHVLDNAFKKRK